MSWLCNTPIIESSIWLPHSEKPVEAVIYGARSVPGYPLLFLAFLCDESGATYWNLPIRCLRQRGLATGDNPDLVENDSLYQWYDCPSDTICCEVIDFLKGRKCACRTHPGERKQRKGDYVCTFDWIGTGTTAEGTGDWGHKCAHLIALDCGRFCLVPNNGVRFADAVSVADPTSDTKPLPLNRLPMRSIERVRKMDSEVRNPKQRIVDKRTGLGLESAK